MTRCPSLFVSHGSPMLAVQDSAAARFLDRVASSLPRPRAVVVASAHYEAPDLRIGANPDPVTVHDFSGFPPELSRMRYGAKGDAALAARIALAARQAGIDATVDHARDLDHGAWVPLLRMYPQADVPVVPVSISPRHDAAWHFALGAALAGFRNEGVLVLGSGGFVHNLRELSWNTPDSPLEPWALAFTSFMRDALAAGDVAALLDWRRRAPHAARAHPTSEHLMPLFVALGAASPIERVELLHSSHELGALALDAFAFG